MKQPKRRGTSISDNRVDGWFERFVFYRDPPTRAKINCWLNYFTEPHRDISARILDCVELISEREIHDGYRAALQALQGWHTNKKHRSGNWYFIGVGGAGESGSALLGMFRRANQLNASIYDYLFKNSTDLHKLNLTATDTVVFVDDFSGSGDQICGDETDDQPSGYWDTVRELMGSHCNAYLVLTVATQKAQDRIGMETDAILTASLTLKEEDNVFSIACKYFNQAEQEILLGYCEELDENNPKGYGDSGLLLVMSHSTPNNTIPILHFDKPEWRGLFPRYL